MNRSDLSATILQFNALSQTKELHSLAFATELLSIIDAAIAISDEEAT